MGNGRIASLFDSRIDWATVEPHLANMNKISVDLHAALLGAGFYTPIGYWTVELSLDAVGGVNLPKSLVEFTKQGSRATAYEMGGLSAGTDLSVTLSAGYSRRITDELTVGGRINFIGGLARANVTYNRLDATLNSDTWSIAADGTLTASLNGLRKADHLINEEGLHHRRPAQCRHAAAEHEGTGRIRHDLRPRRGVCALRPLQVLGRAAQPGLPVVESEPHRQGTLRSLLRTGGLLLRIRPLDG